MKKLYGLLFLGGMLLFVVNYRTWFDVNAQSSIPSTDSDFINIQGRIKTFFEGINESSSSETAYRTLLQGTQGQENVVKEIAQKTDELTRSQGSRAVSELYDVKRVGKDVILARYLYKYESYPIVWYFTFYRSPNRATETATPNNNWHCIGIRFDTSLDSFFKEAKESSSSKP
ncbi:MAG: hypothetical protein LBJ67_12580 [Planctomycetaceae bacterium]|jgi:hypothetical protein|nr:hypothetical protein [Planctomycetaceae bacterium]